MEARIGEEAIKKIVLTGGPCAGKTTALNYLAEKLSDYGFSVFTVPELATMLINAGVNLGELAATDYKKYLQIEEKMIFSQLALEDLFHGYAALCGHKKNVILCDRGVMDILAYIEREYFDAVLASRGLKVTDLRDGRYDAIMHLVSAAFGAEEFYTLANNTARRETLEEARDAEKRTSGVWIGHPHLRAIDNSTDFELKMKRVLQAVCRVLGIPIPLEIERRFLVADLPDFERLGIKFEKIDIEQMYLQNGRGAQKRIRKRGQYGSHVFYQTFKQSLREGPPATLCAAMRAGVRSETEIQIGPKQYLALSYERDPEKKIIRKNRYCFLWQNQYFEFDEFIEPRKGLYILEIELTEENERVVIPDFVSVIREVTDDSGYSNYEIASL